VDFRSDHETAALSGNSGSTAGSTTYAFAVAVVAPLLIHPTPGFFVGAGPAFYAELSNSTSSAGTSNDNGKETSLGLMATIGGAF
jgi:hypothetical protein